jgi:hypothetical protein
LVSADAPCQSAPLSDSGQQRFLSPPLPRRGRPLFRTELQRDEWLCHLVDAAQWNRAALKPPAGNDPTGRDVKN